MAELLDRELATGALGLSSGLEYDPGIYAETSELVTLARRAAAAGGRYISHVRSEDRRFFEAIEEAIGIGRAAGIPVQISHLKLAMRSLWGQTDRLLATLDAARAEGVEVSVDVYPYEYWQSTMTVLFPDRDFTDLAEASFALSEITTPGGMLIARFDPEPSYVGKTLADIASLRGRDAVPVFLELIAESQAAAADPLDPPESIIATSMATADIDRLMTWPHANVCTDGSLRGRHPRGFGAFPRVLGDLVRERGVLSLAEAVRRSSALAAEHVGITGRGVIEPGAFADLVLFDPATIDDRATPRDPHATAIGIERVWVNGVEVYSGGQVTGARPGRVVRRDAP
jgi:N-acyl-D-amino-acid deacylase